MLLQEPVDYRKKLERGKLTFPTKVKPDEATIQKLLDAWEVVRRVQSNGIVVADGKPRRRWAPRRVLDGGSGELQEEERGGEDRPRQRGERATGAVCASDGFFPFRDNVDLLGKAGVSAAIQPGGSINDAEVVKAADEYGIAMAMTHTRAFKH